MQAVPGMAAAPAAPAVIGWPSILPGPFILLLLLPAFPLILFSIGARPPDTSALPFTTDDLWQTTAFITVAGAVVLSMGLYPGILSDASAWIKDGGGGIWRTYLVDLTDALTSKYSPTARGAAAQRGMHQQHLHQDQWHRRPQSNQHRQAPATVQQPTDQVVVRYEDVPGTPHRVEYRPPEYRQDRRGKVVYRPGAKRVMPGTKASKRLVVETIKVQPPPRLDPKDHSYLSSRHLSALRESSLKAYYSPNKPTLSLILLALLVTVACLIVLTGKILHPTYDSDTAARKSSSKGAEVDSWYVRELSKRKKEKEKETIARNKEQEASFVGRLAKMDKETRDREVKKRKQEMELLRKELTKRKLPLVGLDWDLDGKGKNKKKSSGPSRSGKGDDKAKSKEEGQSEKGQPGKIRKMLLGPLADGVPKETTSGGGKSLLKDGGPGWRPADDAVAHAAIRGGAARAESMANNLVAQKGG